MDDDILVWDIETTPNQGDFWRAGYRLTIPWANIKGERQICVIGYRWLSQKRIHTLCWKDQDDAGIIEKFIPILERARYSVAYNGRSYDERFLRGRAIYHQIPMSPYHTMVDPLRQLKRYTLLNSYAMDYVARFLNLGRKIKTSYELWERITYEDHQESLRSMARYCRQDCQMLTDIYEATRAYFPAVDSIAEQISDCPYCGSSNTAASKQRTTVQLGERVQFQCRDCGQYHTVAKSRYDKAKSQTAA